MFSLAHLTLLECSPPKLVDIAARTGYDFVSLRMTPVTPAEHVYPLIGDRRLMRETKARLADTGLEVLDVELLRLDPATNLEGFLPFLEAGAELGARSVITQIPDPDRNRAIDRYGRLCDLAKPYDLDIALEFVSWTETPDLSVALTILEAAGRSNGKILVDILHFSRSGSTIADLMTIPSEWFPFVHLCDAPANAPSTVEEIIHSARTERLFPGNGGLNIRGIVEAIPEVPCSLEIPNTQLLKRLGPEGYARTAIEAAKNCLAQVAGYVPQQTNRERTRKAPQRQNIFRHQGTAA